MARILVVEDSPTQAEACRLILSGDGHTIEVAGTAMEALERLSTHAIDVVVSDVMMPGLSGYDLCRHIRARSKMADIPIILLTALKHPSDVLNGLECGADTYVLKPFEPEDLLHRVQAVLANQRLRRPDVAPIDTECMVLGRRLALTGDPQRGLEFLLSTFEDFIRARERESRSEAALDDANRRYRSLFENAADAIFVADDDGCYVDLNHQAEVLSGFSRERLLQMRIMDLVDDGDARLERNGESSLRRSTGEVVPVEFSTRRTEPGRYQTIVRDVSHRQQAEEARVQLRAEEALRTMVEGTAAAIGQDFMRVLVDRLPTALQGDAAVACEIDGGTVRVLALSPAGPAAWPLAESITADVLSRRVTWYPDALSRFPLDPLLAGLKATGFLGVPLVSSSGQPIGMLAVLGPEVQAEPRTISTLQVFAARAAVEVDRQRAEAALRRSEEQYRNIIETTDQGVLRIDPGGAIMYANRQAAELLGAAPGHLIGRPWLDLVSPEHRDMLTPVAPHREQRDVRFQRADGTALWTILSISPVLDDHGNTNGSLAMLTDITTRRYLEEQLRQAQKMEAIGQLAGGIAHDFNNLLTAINGYGEIVRSSLDAGDARRADINAILQAGDSAARLVRQLLVFSRKEVVKPAVLSLNKVVLETQQILSRLIGENITIETRLDPNLWVVFADPGRLQQIIINLAVNSRDAMPDGGRIKIQTSNTDIMVERDLVPGAYVVLTVSDTGAGMTPEVQGRIFDPFFTTKEPGKGTGLGLPTVNSIVREAGGSVSVYSEIGMGTTFRIYLPRSHASATPVSKAETPQAPPCTETILVVEDEGMVRELTMRLLSRAGYRVAQATNGAEALQKLASVDFKVHLVMTDVVLPEMSGPDLAAQIRQRYPDVKILFMSGYSPHVVLQPGLLSDLKVLLEKPFSPQTLLDKVRLALQQE